MRIFSLRNFLIFTIISSFLIRVINLNYNTPFIDEAIYIVLGQKILDGNWQQEYPFSWIGGMPFFYPVLTALASNIMNITGSRLLNALLGTGSVYLVYLLASRMRLFPIDYGPAWNKLNALIAAFFFGISSLSLWLSRLANYDMLAIFFFLLGLLALFQSFEKKSIALYIIAGVIFFIAFLAKYTIFMWFPFIFVVSFVSGIFIYRTFFNRSLFFITLLTLFLFTYIGTFYEELLSLFSGNIVQEGSSITIITDFFDQTWLWYLLALGGLGAYIKVNEDSFFSKKTLLYSTIFILSIVPLSMHLITGNTATVEQNSIYALILILPLSALIFTYFTKEYFRLGLITFAIAAIGISTFSYLKLRELERSWPNSGEAMTFLESKVEAEDRVLAESDDVAVLALREKIEYSRINGPFFFSYKNLEGTEAYERALQDKYFTYIELENANSDLAKIVNNSVQDRYRRIYDKNSFQIFEVIP